MNNESEDLCTCATCGRNMHDGKVTSDTRGPCPDCGSKARAFAATVTENFGISIGHRAKLFSDVRRPRKPGKARKPLIDERSMDEVYKLDGRLYRVERTLNYEKDHYFEKITDKKTGAIVKQVEGKLSEHQGFGSAKKK